MSGTLPAAAKAGVAAVTAVLCGMVLVGCGDNGRPGLDDDNDLGTVGTARGEEGVRDAARAYLDAWSSGNPTIACGLTTARKARIFGMSAGNGNCPDAFDNVRGRMSEDARTTYQDTQIAEVKMIGGADGTTARVTLTRKLEGPVNGKDNLLFEHIGGRWQTEGYPKE
ncbi:hypothetical protein BBK82_44955 [Lentzea guizhouensis]|uniref:DUF4878 domain-containing protein n=1 Tax=Lentzea guizhouensis TaxID=1586287 RepID=A0A1B2HWG2_9PSEU|nr:hypothetical protein [Lentzea guizhouensis]ANZ42025.1 hypothetical protein BBK82_44955 [Lentzea guizhouensis]